MFIFFTNSAIVFSSLVRSHVVFKFLNYVTDKIVRVVLTTLALMLSCVQNYMFVCEREREREGYVLSVHNKTKFCGKNMDKICRFYPSVYCIFLIGQCRCGFWLFFCPLK